MTSKHGWDGRAGSVVPRTIDDLLHHISNFNFIITLIFGETSLLSTQYRVAVDIVEEFRADLASTTGGCTNSRFFYESVRVLRT